MDLGTFDANHLDLVHKNTLLPHQILVLLEHLRADTSLDVSKDPLEVETSRHVFADGGVLRLLPPLVVHFVITQRVT